MSNSRAKVTFLGTAGDASTMGKCILQSGGIIIEEKNMQININPGPTVLSDMATQKCNVRNTDIIITCGRDTLFSGGLLNLIDAISLEGEDRRGIVIGPRALVEESEIYSPLLTKQHKNRIERILALRQDDKVGIGDITIKPTLTHKNEEELLGFIIQTPQYHLGIVGTSFFTKSLAEQYKTADVLIINLLTRNVMKEKASEHTTLEQDQIRRLTSFIKIAKPRVVFITGFNVKILQTSILSFARIIQKECDIQVIAAKDGYTFCPQAYAKKERQSLL